MAQLAQAGEDVAAVQLWRSLIPRLDAEQRTVGALGSDARRHLAEGILRLQGNQGRRPGCVLAANLLNLLEEGREETHAARIAMTGWVADAGTAREALPA